MGGVDSNHRHVTTGVTAASLYRLKPRIKLTLTVRNYPRASIADQGRCSTVALGLPPQVWNDRGVALNYGVLVGGTHLTRNDCVPRVPNRTSATCLARNLLLHQVPQRAARAL
jgi:hypothetical protein